MEQDIHTRLMQQLQGQEGIERAMMAAQNAYPRLFAQIEELVSPDSSNVDEISDYLLHVIEAYVQLQQSPLYTIALCHQIFKVLTAVEQSYYLPPALAGTAGSTTATANATANASGSGDAAQPFVLTLDTALMITLLAMMAGLKDLKTIASYSNYANQYLQLLLPAMMHPRYRISSVNCRTVMRLFNYELLQGFFTNFFARAKVATKLSPASLLSQVQPSLAQLPHKGLMGLSYQDLSGFVPCLGLDHGVILGPRPLLFLCADRLLLNGYDYLLSLNHLPLQRMQQLQMRLAQRSRSKFLIDKIDAYYDILDEISEDMRSVVCIRRRNAQGMWEEFFFVSTLEPNTSSLYRIQSDYGDCESALLQSSSYLMSVSRHEKEQAPDFLPQREDFNRFIVELLNHERQILTKINGANTLSSWDEVLFRNGSNPNYAIACFFYYFLSDVLDPNLIASEQRKVQMSNMTKPSLTTILRTAHGFAPAPATSGAPESMQNGTPQIMPAPQMPAPMTQMPAQMQAPMAPQPQMAPMPQMQMSMQMQAPMTQMPQMQMPSQMQEPVPQMQMPSQMQAPVPQMQMPEQMQAPVPPLSRAPYGAAALSGATGSGLYMHSSPVAQAANAALQAKIDAQAKEQARVFAQQVRSPSPAPAAPAASAGAMQGSSYPEAGAESQSQGVQSDYRMGPGMDLVYRPRRIYGSHAYNRARMAYAQTQGLDDLPADAAPYPQGSAAAQLTGQGQGQGQSPNASAGSNGNSAFTVHENRNNWRKK